MSEPGYARHTDPSTSHDAAATANTSALERVVLSAAYAAGYRGITSAEAAVITGHARVTLSPRFKPLERAGRLVRTEQRRGRSQVWVHRDFATDDGGQDHA